MFIFSVDSAREPVETRNITDPEEELFGFLIVWNVPELSEFIDEYEVLIEDKGRRSRRNEPMRFLVPSIETSYEFTDGTAYTDYLARVDALVYVSGIIGRVPALLPIPLQTAQGSELALGHTLEFCSCTTSSLPSLSLSLLCIPVSSPPDIVERSNIKITSCYLKWTAPDMPNGRIVGYRVSISTTPSVHM